MNAKSWETPTLIVLTRSKPEEHILIGCKTEASGITPGTTAQNCGTLAELGNCSACQARGGGIS